MAPSDNTTPPETQTFSENAGPVYPSIIFALTPTIRRDAVLKAFNGEGMTPIMVNSGDEMVKAVTRPEVFLIIVDVEFNDKRGLAFHAQLKGSTLSFWIALAKKLTTNQRSSLYAQGFADVLTHPVHPVLFKSRARMLLARYLKSNDFPEHVVLPPGMSRKAPVAGKNAIDNSTKISEGTQSGLRKSGSQQTDENGNFIHISGSGNDSQGPDWNIHSSKNYAQDSGKAKILKGDSDKSPDWNHHNSEIDSNYPAWQNKISPNEKPEASETKFFKKDDPKGSWNNKITPNDPTQRGGNIHITNDPANSSVNFNPGSTTNAPEDKANSQSSKNSILSEKKPQTVVQSEKPPSSASTTLKNSSHQGTTAKPRGEIKLDLSQGSLDLTQSKDPPPQRPNKTLGQIREKILELKSNVEWDQKLWPKHKLPKGSIPEITSRGLKKCIVELEILFREAATLLKADRLTLISLKPDALPKSAYCPEDLYALCSNDGTIKINDEVPSVFFPQIEVAFERRKAVLLNEPISDPLDGKTRPAQWKINGKIEASSAVFPVFLDSKPYAVLFIQFSEKADEARIKLIEQAVSFLGLPETHYSQVDFLSRVYRSQKNS